MKTLKDIIDRARKILTDSPYLDSIENLLEIAYERGRVDEMEEVLKKF